MRMPADMRGAGRMNLHDPLSLQVCRESRAGTGERENDEESRSRPRPGVRPHFSAVVQNRLARQRQAETRAILLAGAGKGLEEPVPDFGGNARPGVRDPNDDVFPIGPAVDRDAAAAGHDLQGIDQKVAEGALQAAPIRRYNEVFRARHVDFYLLRFRGIAQWFDGSLQDLPQRALFTSSASVSPANIQQVVQQLLDSLGRLGEIGGKALLLGSGQ